MADIKYYKQLAFCPAYEFIMEGYVEQLNTNPGLQHYINFGNKSEVLYAVDDEKIVGAQLFTIDQLGRCYVQVSHILPAYNHLKPEFLARLEVIMKKRLGEHAHVIYTLVEPADIEESTYTLGPKDHYTAQFVKQVYEA